MSAYEQISDTNISSKGIVSVTVLTVFNKYEVAFMTMQNKLLRLTLRMLLSETNLDLQKRTGRGAV